MAGSFLCSPLAQCESTPCHVRGQSVADNLSSCIACPGLCTRLPPHLPHRIPCYTPPCLWHASCFFLYAECQSLAAEHVIPDLGSRKTMKGKRRGCLSAKGHVGTPPALGSATLQVTAAWSMWFAGAGVWSRSWRRFPGPVQGGVCQAQCLLSRGRSSRHRSPAAATIRSDWREAFNSYPTCLWRR